MTKVIRSDRHIENNLYWYLDDVFKDDFNKFYINESQKNLNIIRKFCLGIIKRMKVIHNQSVNSTMQILSMSFEKYRENF